MDDDDTVLGFVAGTIGDNITNRVIDSMYDKIKSIIKGQKAKRKFYTDTGLLLKAHEHERYYNELTKYLTNAKILNSLYESIGDMHRNFASSGNNHMDHLACTFYESCGSNNNMISEMTCKLFFGRLFNIIFDILDNDLSQNEKASLTYIKRYCNDMESRIQKSLESIPEIKQNVSDIKDTLSENKERIEKIKDVYIERYISEIFPEDETVTEGDVKLILSDIYITPDYKENDSSKKDALSQIYRFIGDDEKKALIISGDPAVGKTSLISRFIHDMNLKGKTNNIVIVPFRVLENNDNSIMGSICKEFNISSDQYFSDKILILDGYDEYSILNDGNTHKNDVLRLLEKLFEEYSAVRNCKVIITTRPNCIPRYDGMKKLVSYITLLPFDSEKIKEYILQYVSRNHRDNINKLRENYIDTDLTEIIGIPMILYMICHFDMNIDDMISRADIYDRIFSKDGLILTGKHSKGHKITHDNREEFIKVPMNIAFNMYKNNSLIYSVTESIESDPIFNGISDDSRSMIQKIFGMACYYKDDIVSTRKIEFIHKSLYEYFLARYFYDIMIDGINNNISDESYLKKVIETLKWGNVISHQSENETMEYLKYLISTHMTDEKYANLTLNRFDYIISCNFFHSEAYDNNSSYPLYKHVDNVFCNYWNMMYMLFCDSEDNLNKKYAEKLNAIITKDRNRAVFQEFISHNSLCDGFNLSGLQLYTFSFNLSKLSETYLIGADLGGADLSGADLSGADLAYAKLIGAKLSGANLIDANLIGADLAYAKLIGADLAYAKLIGADLRDAKLIGADLRDAKLIGATLSGADLNGADLSGADLRDAKLSGAKLSGADLSGADLIGVDLRGVDFINVDLIGAGLIDADLRGAYLRGAYLSEVTETKFFARFNFENIKRAEMYIHKSELEKYVLVQTKQGELLLYKKFREKYPE